MPAREKESYSIRSVDNALALLEALSEEDEELSLSRLSERMGLNKASVFRLLATFERRGYVERRQGSRDYQLGPSAYEIGQKLLSRMGLLRKARPVMEKLVRECDEAAYLVVRRSDDALFLDMVDNLQQVKVVSLVGRRLPLESCAAGKIFLAFDDNIEQDLKDKLTKEERESIRRQGFAGDCHGIGEGGSCIAVPLFDAAAEVAGVLALVGPEFRMPSERIEKQLLPALKNAGETICSKLGYLGYALKQTH
ncbi:IclR family transcriptional regulator [Geoalkalibacter halelectricus]|uniref:IclR family transcriptional regulator n=1 Tax=Geoalkalibacter halelectricus TaxID=2847045 RepID=A0ABY5ZU39_9BACT|nr:IclR family transcriptional regulator [Geoalkalibacter halelectricus]MDO3376668.1 IclR family transcriptional regulator [Geoalkalibacter halelectricus]UWZ81380.1 IclR family transcriptional regulator [Geoalkalibacter halelectricus]